jgi:predicted metal-dependent hydrolase
MEKIIYHGKPLPLIIDFHALKKSRLEIKDNHALATLCYDLSTKQQLNQIRILTENLYRRSTSHIIEETLLLLQNFAPRTIRGIRYKKMRSRWGSASANKNLNFNIDLAKLPLEIQQYIVIHEYCHLFEMNHSAKFWAKVEQFDPRYRDHRRQLRLLEKSWSGAQR